MIIKTYQAATLEEAYAKMNYDATHLNQDTSVLNTRTYTRGGIFGLFGRPVVELTVAVDERKAQAAQAAQAQVQAAAQPAEQQPVYQDVAAGAPQMPFGPQPVAQTQMQSMQAGTAVATATQNFTFSGRLGNIAPAPSASPYGLHTLPGVLPKVAHQLVNQEIDEKIVLRILNDIAHSFNPRECGDENLVYQYVRDRLSRIIFVGGPIEHREKHLKVVACVGPTGAGKTTTIAKLAADFTFTQRKRVALITIDTFRIGAVEQLNKYAQIMDLPMEVVMTPQDLKCAVNKHSDKDVILIDTAGRSPRDEMNLTGLKGFMSMIQPCEVHLVLSAGAREKDLLDVIDRFGRIGIDKVIFSKMDETARFGMIVNILDKVSMPISYLTIGQNVPSDIAIADARELANLIVQNAQLLE